MAEIEAIIQTIKTPVKEQPKRKRKQSKDKRSKSKGARSRSKSKKRNDAEKVVKAKVDKPRK